MFLENLIQEPWVPFCLSRDLKVCAFELSVALQRRFNDCSAVFIEVYKVDNFNCCFSTWVRLDGGVGVVGGLEVLNCLLDYLITTNTQRRGRCGGFCGT